MSLEPAADAVDRFRADLSALVDRDPRRLGLAVSGGADSLALLLLGQAAIPGGVSAATIDHGLRPEAAAEAAFVGSVCARLGVEHVILSPSMPIQGNLQSRAREVRYALLEDWRRRSRLDWLATGHHADDQAETLLMRLNRSSGISGLSAIRPINGKVIRPLLAWRRVELEAIVAEAGIQPVTDPSNSDERFDRVRMRRQIRDAPWIDPAALARSALTLGEAEESLQFSAARLWEERALAADEEVRLDIKDLPGELRRRLVRRALERLAPGREIRGEDLGRFMAAMECGRGATLAGVKGSPGVDWRFSLAPPRRR